MTPQPGHRQAIEIRQALVGDLNEYTRGFPGSPQVISADRTDIPPSSDFDRRITNEGLRNATLSRFISGHYADAVEAGVKALNECVRQRSGSTVDGDALMTSVFSEKNPKLRLNRMRTDSERSEQRGHMFMCQGVVAAWRNPRAHSSNFEDSPEKALMMLEYLQHLIEVTLSATKTRTKRK